MAEINVKELADALYSSFLARDFFAKVVPGGVILASLALSTLDTKLDWSNLKDVPFLVWLLLYGVCWALGFVVQAMGEAVHLFRAFPCDETEDDFRKRLVEFNAANPSSSDKIQRERYSVIKEATGNMAVAGLLGAVVLGVACFLPSYRTLLYILVGLLGFCFLGWYHRLHQRRDRDWQKEVISRASSGTKETS